jgi:hypothetical protein
MDNILSFTRVLWSGRIVINDHRFVASPTVNGRSPMKHIWAIIFVLAAAIGASSPLQGVPLITGSILIVAAVLIGLSLRFSGFGRWFLGRLWPGQFADGKQKRLATSLVLVLLLAYVLWGIGTLLGSLHGSSSLLEQIKSMLTVLGLLGSCGLLWAQAIVVRRGE